MTDSSTRPKPRVFRPGDPAVSKIAAPPPATLDDDPTLTDGPAPPLPQKSGSAMMRIVWAALAGLVSLWLGAWIYEFVVGLFQTNSWLGWTALVLAGIVFGALLLFAIRELASLARMGKVDALQKRATQAWESNDRAAAERVEAEILALYRNRADFDRARKEIRERRGDAPDADTLLTLIERETMQPLDSRASDAARRAAGHVAAATALLPSGLLDAAAVLYLNVRMVREIAQVYEGRAGWLGSWRLLKQVAFHLAATGAIALGDDLVGAVVGGGMLGKLSRRAGEGVLNGTLTARIGVATMEVCRPLPFRAISRPTARGIAASALSGFLKRAESKPS